MQVLITGGTGSFGMAFAKKLLNEPNLERLVLYARGEHKHEEAARVLDDARVRSFIGDVRDLQRLRSAISGIDIVIHAAALKVVPLAEYNPLEAIRTNILGAENVIQACLDSGVQRVLALSTDKAVAPANLYGATKLCAERLFQAANNLAGGRRTRFSIVRYGNVAGSAGSVIPLWMAHRTSEFPRGNRNGSPLPITSPDMTRFWLTLGQASDFISGALREMKGGEIFVPKLKSFRIIDLAEAFKQIWGAESHVIGVRPGEKLHESLISADEQGVLDNEDHYLIAPAVQYAHEHLYPGNAVSLAYTSSNNDKWMTVEDLVWYLE